MPDESAKRVDAILLKGGGVKGLAFAGVLQELEGHFAADAYVGTSAGAIAAVLLAGGLDPAELETALSSLDFESLLDTPRGLRLLRLVSSGYVHSGDAIQAWIRERLSEHVDRVGKVSLSDLPTRAIIYAAAHPSGTLVFDSKGEFGQDIDSAFAARCSMSIPWFFRSPLHEGRRVYDGGVLHNFPVRDYLRRSGSENWLGVYLGTGRPEDRRRSTLFELLAVLLGQDESAVLDEHRDRVVVVDTGPIGTVDFDLSDIEKRFLVESGRLAALRYLSLCELGDSQLPASILRAERKIEQLRPEVQRRATRRNARRIVSGILTALVVSIVAGTSVAAVWAALFPSVGPVAGRYECSVGTTNLDGCVVYLSESGRVISFTAPTERGAGLEYRGVLDCGRSHCDSRIEALYSGFSVAEQGHGGALEGLSRTGTSEWTGQWVDGSRSDRFKMSLVSP